MDLFRRDSDSGHWVLYPFVAGDEVQCTSVGLSVPMAELYEDVRLEA